MPLADNGGFTKTCAITAGSQAFDGLSEAVQPIEPTDQRGATR